MKPFDFTWSSFPEIKSLTKRGMHSAEMCYKPLCQTGKGYDSIPFIMVRLGHNTPAQAGKIDKGCPSHAAFRNFPQKQSIPYLFLIGINEKFFNKSDS